MKEQMMSESDWRTVQMFLTTSGVYEVEINIEDYDVRCSCLGYKTRLTCAHVSAVDKAAKNNGGTYPIKISSRASEEDSEVAQVSKEAFREFVLKYGKVEVM